MSKEIKLIRDLNGVNLEFTLTPEEEKALLTSLLAKYPIKTSDQSYKYQPKTKEELKALCKDECIYLGDIDTSLITDMSYLFVNSARKDFRGIETWDTSKVTNMSGMFQGAESFNQPIGNWNVSNVTDMSHMFESAHSFNQDIGNWDASRVANMSYMLSCAGSFNQDIGNWDVSHVTNMQGMFADAFSFNQDIGSWDVSKVIDMRSMFAGAEDFNKDISHWKLSPMVDKTEMFEDCPISEENKPRIDKVKASTIVR